MNASTYRERPCAVCGAPYWAYVTASGRPHRLTCGDVCAKAYQAQRVRAYHRNKRTIART